MGERDFITLLDGVHQLAGAPIVLVWDRLNTHVPRRMQGLVAERAWLTVFLLPHTRDGFIAGTGLTLDDPTSPWRAEISRRRWRSRPARVTLL